MNVPASAVLLALLALAPAEAANRFEEVREIAADGLIEVGNVAGSIRVRATQRDDVRISGSVGEGASGLRIEGDRRRLKVAIEYPDSSGGWRGWWGGGRRDDSVLELEIPAGVALKVDAVSASVDVAGAAGRRVDVATISGSVKFDGSPSRLEIESVSGAVEVDSQGIGEVVLGSVSGRIRLSGPVRERLRAESVSGAMRLQPEGALQALQVSVVSGDIELRAALAPNGRLSAESLSGTLDVTLPPSTSARLRASSFSGTIRSEVGTVERETFGPGSSLDATLGDGDGEIRLESFSGTLRFRLD
jgi:hypothetical protein